MTLRRVLLALGLICLAGQAAIAKPLPDGGITVQEMTEVLKADGYPIEMATWGGEPVINTSVNGIKFGVHFFECDSSGRCQSILFSSSW